LRCEIKFLDAVGNADSGIVRGDISDAGFCHIAIPLFHFDGDPAKREENFFRFGDDGDDEVGEAVVHLKLNDLGIDQDEAKIVGAKSVKEAEEESVDADRFSGAGGAGDEGVRKIGQVVDQCRPVNVLSEGNGEMGGGGVPLGTFDEIAEEDFDFRGVGDLDGDRVATGNGGENVDAFRLHRSGKIAFEITDSFHADAGGGVEFVASDGGAAGDVAGADLDIEVGERLDDSLLVGLKFVLGEGGANVFFRFLKKIDGGEFVFVVGGTGCGGGGRRGGFGSGLGFGSGIGWEGRERGGRDAEFLDFRFGFLLLGRLF
jgi:hypothetical protein